ncbi:MAG TPA: hypothetical protein VFX58_01690 [Chitinophagaceae bacterium]|nr:hypothetical protein [Chitinophagaceae bacterium]
MKKLFLVLAVASLGFVACNNEADTKADTIDSTAEATKDSIEVTSDSLKVAVDSLAEAQKDSLKTP